MGFFISIYVIDSPELGIRVSEMALFGQGADVAVLNVPAKHSLVLCIDHILIIRELIRVFKREKF